MLSNLDELINFSKHLADESEKLIKNYFRTSLNIESKEDKSPVTLADKEVELKIRDLINKKYPSHGILGEEFDSQNIDSEFLWVIDPIDGTRSFIAGHKDFGTLIALIHNGKPIIGIINCPMHNERWIGIIDKKTTMNDGIVKTSKFYGSFGNYIEIDHGNGYVTVYGHLHKRNVKKGQKVERGQLIGQVGNTGRSTAPHLHYEVKYKNKTLNPSDFYFDISL